MPKNVRVGLIGTSWWADGMYLPSLKSHPQADLAAICGRDPVRAKEMASKYSIPSVYADYRQMLAQAGLDAVIIAAPDDLHHAMTLVALEAGLHVLCEKPMSMHAGDAREMAEKAGAAGVKHMVMYSWRWHPAVRYLYDLVQEGYVGRIYHCDFSFFGGYARDPIYQWRVDKNRSAGVLGDLGSHLIDLAHWLVGDIAAVSARLAACLPHTDTEGRLVNSANDSAQLLVKFANGTQGSIQSTWLAHLGDHLRVNLYGEAGTLEMDLQFGSLGAPSFRGARSQEETLQNLVIPEKYLAGMNPADFWSVFNTQSAGPRLFIDSILTDRPISPNFWDGYRAQQVIDAAILSNEVRCAVDIPAASMGAPANSVGTAFQRRA